MIDSASMVAALAELERIEAAIHRIPESEDRASLSELVALRRQFSIQLGTISELGDQLFGADRDNAPYGEFRRHFSRMRSAAALHQANWPAVRITAESRSAYLTSAQQVRAASQDLADWIRRELAPAGKRDR